MNSTNKSSIRLLYDFFRNRINDQLVLCKNLNTIADDCNVLVDNLSKNLVKQNPTFSKLPDDQNWKILLIYELLDQNIFLLTILTIMNDIIRFYVVCILTNK